VQVEGTARDRVGGGPEARARRVIDTNLYMVLSTADASGLPWVSPVYFTPHEYVDLYWLSSPDALHSRNIRQRPDVSIVVFDSQVAIGAAEAVYLRARASEVPHDELDRCAALFRSRVPEVQSFGPEQMRAPEPLRLFRATVIEHSMLIRGGDPAYDRAIDFRLPLSL
jgi:nitroimidazol reductase NimA-like FMN-containing flavoprotein (pyridoxamine 5'-phosphate oxidase superfamily)